MFCRAVAKPTVVFAQLGKHFEIEMFCRNVLLFQHSSTPQMFCRNVTARPAQLDSNDFGPTCIPQNVANEMFCRVVRIPRWVLQHFNKTFRRELFCRIVLSNCSFFEYHVGGYNSTKHFGEAAHVELFCRAVLLSCANIPRSA